MTSIKNELLIIKRVMGIEPVSESKNIVNTGGLRVALPYSIPYSILYLDLTLMGKAVKGSAGTTLALDGLEQKRK